MSHWPAPLSPFTHVTFLWSTRGLGFVVAVVAVVLVVLVVDVVVVDDCLP